MVRVRGPGDAKEKKRKIGLADLLDVTKQGPRHEFQGGGAKFNKTNLI